MFRTLGRAISANQALCGQLGYPVNMYACREPHWLRAGLDAVLWLTGVAAGVAVSSSNLQLLKHMVQKGWFESAGSEDVMKKQLTQALHAAAAAVAAAADGGKALAAAQDGDVGGGAAAAPATAAAAASAAASKAPAAAHDAAGGAGAGAAAAAAATAAAGSADVISSAPAAAAQAAAAGVGGAADAAAAATAAAGSADVVSSAPAAAVQATAAGVGGAADAAAACTSAGGIEAAKILLDYCPDLLDFAIYRTPDGEPRHRAYYNRSRPGPMFTLVTVPSFDLLPLVYNLHKSGFKGIQLKETAPVVLRHLCYKEQKHQPLELVQMMLDLGCVSSDEEVTYSPSRAECKS